MATGVYGQAGTFGISITPGGYGTNFSFSQSFIGPQGIGYYASSTLSVGWSGWSFQVDRTQIAFGPPTGTPTPWGVTGSVTVDPITGVITAAGGISTFSDFLEIGVVETEFDISYGTDDPQINFSGLVTQPSRVSSNPAQTGPVAWGYDENYLDYLSEDPVARESLRKAIEWRQKLAAIRNPAEEYTEPFAGPKCFAAGTRISLPDGSTLPIETIAALNSVASYAEHDESGVGPVRAPLRAGRVTRTFTNVTTEWIELHWRDPSRRPLDGRAPQDEGGGELRTLTATPGHVMLTPQGTYRQLGEMVTGGRKTEDGRRKGGKELDRPRPLTKGQRFGAPIGTVELVDARGRIVTAKAFLRLLKGIRIWAATRKAKRILVHVTTGRDLKATDKLLRAAGMQGVGGGYVG